MSAALIAAARAALEALESIDGPLVALFGALLAPDADAPGAKVRASIEALRAALAAAPEQSSADRAVEMAQAFMRGHDAGWESAKAQAPAAPIAQPIDERAAFENWVTPTLRAGSHLERSRINHVYTDNRVAAKWAAWQARASMEPGGSEYQRLLEKHNNLHISTRRHRDRLLEMEAMHERGAARLQLAEYIIGAFERGADPSEYGRDIAEFRA